MRGFIRQFVGYSLGSFYASLILLKLFIDFIRSPIKFPRDFFKTRHVMPTCLNDPSLGSHRFISFGGTDSSSSLDVKLHYVVSGDEKKPLMLMLHGYPAFWYAWKYQIKEFSKDYRVVAVDQRGYADSDKPSGWRNYTLSKVAGDIKQLIPALGYSSCTLLGHDVGGIVAWQFACHNPNMVDKLIVLNSASHMVFEKHITTNALQFLKSWYVFFFQIPLIPEFMFIAGDFAMLDFIFDAIPNNKPTEEDVEAHKYIYSAKGAVTSPLNYYRAQFRVAATPLPVFEKPALVIWAEPDPALNTEMAYMGKEHASNLTVKIIKDSNHHVQIDKYQECNDLIREFLTTA